MGNDRRGDLDLNIGELPTDQHEAREPGITIDTLIIHSMYNPDGDRFSLQGCKECLDRRGVSAHYIVDINGAIWRCVHEERKAWHAGVSRMPDPADGREKVNEFSIGIEIIGSEDTDFSASQYRSLARLTADILSRHRIQNILGHSDIAPDRKTDPWGLDWERYYQETAKYADLQGVAFRRA